MSTGVTPNGTAWTSFVASVSGAGFVRYGRPDSLAFSPIPVLFYTHGAGGTSDQFETSTAWDGLRNWSLDNGWGWIEGSMGGANAWGNPASDTATTNSFDYVDGILDISAVVALARSMGGLAGTRAYLAHLADPRWAGLMVNSGVQDLIWAYDSGRWTSAMNTAWGVSDRAAFVAAVTGYNPIDGPAADWTNTNVLQLWGTADDVVPAEFNAEAMRTMYAGYPLRDRFDVRIGGDHSAGNGSYLSVDAMTFFMQTVIGDIPPEPPAPIAWRALSTRLRAGGAMYAVTF